MATVLVMHAHPDDEVFATGAATVGLAEAGWRVVLRIATGGEAGEGPELPAESARARRIARLEKSCGLLGIHEWDWLSEPGRWIDDGAAGGARSLAAAEPNEVVREVRRQVEQLRPELVLTVGRDGLTGHPDHVAMANAVQSAVDDGRAWGARVRAEDVTKAHAHLQQLRPGMSVGSGVQGAASDVVLRELDGGETAEQRRRQALDQYAQGLGSDGDVLAGRARLGDSVLLRAVFDVTGWRRDLFEQL